MDYLNYWGTVTFSIASLSVGKNDVMQTVGRSLLLREKSWGVISRATAEVGSIVWAKKEVVSGDDSQELLSVRGCRYVCCWPQNCKQLLRVEKQSGSPHLPFRASHCSMILGRRTQSLNFRGIQVPKDLRTVHITKCTKAKEPRGGDSLRSKKKFPSGFLSSGDPPSSCWGSGFWVLAERERV